MTPIWEGTTNVLSLDMLRAVSKSSGKAFISFQNILTKRLEYVTEKDPELRPYADRLLNELNGLIEIASRFKVSHSFGDTYTCIFN